MAGAVLRRGKATAAGTWILTTLIAVAVLAWSLQYGLRIAPAEATGMPSLATPLEAFRGDPPVYSASDWGRRRAPLLRKAFQAEIYGELPVASAPRRLAMRVIDEAAFDGAGRIEEVTLALDGSNGLIDLDVLLMTPRSLAGHAAPVVIAPNFCGNRAALGFRYPEVSSPRWLAARCRTSLGRGATEILHGDSIIRLPFADLLRAGYAVITYSPGELVPDDSSLASAAILRLPLADSDGPRVGAIGAWAWSMSRIVDFASADPHLDRDRIALFGHSRFGKAALLAAALDPRIAAVIANQSGRLGAAPSSDPMGEPLPSLLSHFPHWFPVEARAAAAQSESLDQQLLLALIAPRPVLLGGASLDRWSDPAGAFQSARSASAVYRLFGGTGLDQPSMKATNLDADIAYYFRSGGHGVRRSDWSNATAFLDRQFAARPRALSRSVESQ